MFIRSGNILQSVIFKGYATAGIVYIFLFCFFYPFLLEYQSGSETAKLIPNNKGNLPVGSYQSFSTAFEFYSPGEVNLIYSKEKLNSFIEESPCFVYTSAAVGDSLIRSGVDAEIIGTTQNFHITRLKLGFLNHEKRDALLDTRYLLYVSDTQLD